MPVEGITAATARIGPAIATTNLSAVLSCTVVSCLVVTLIPSGPRNPFPYIIRSIYLDECNEIRYGYSMVTAHRMVALL
jgi:hypothetical protein